VCYSGPASKADEVLAPFRKLGKPVYESVAAIDYVDIQRSWDNTDPRNVGLYQKGGFINEFPGELVDQLLDGFEGDPGRNTTLYFQHSGGAIGRVAVDATAFAHRNSATNMLVFIDWPVDNDPTQHIDYIRRYWKTVEAFTDGYYTNDGSDRTQQVENANYQGNFDRLRQLKETYDPTNLFRLNANIDPTA
jgi:FAD/FMN-containing dehydrogenase